MSIVVYDGENLLVDKITTATHDHYRKVDGKDVEYYSELDCKINFPKGADTFNNKLYGRTVSAYTLVGDTRDQHRVMFLLNSEVVIDLRCISDTAVAWPEIGVLSPETTHLFINEDGGLIEMTMEIDPDKGTYKVIDNIYHPESLAKVGPAVFGQPSAFLNSYNRHLLRRNFTALELMVFGMSRYPGLGRRFDHWHRPTGKLTKDILLSDRQRRHILNKIAKDSALVDLAPVKTLQELYTDEKLT
ncbi:hypothetical protein AVT69_gp353 [Pseudomonas phage PhiPA3]|uniref:Uncharacterized protein 355 n=1 Tax=Pseudomonas phage PhiPA3 TaxID=998086 RepID=F8SJI8_BPPA3|nr:hypothetical protein AVT69_gp353 [Pseudomonas phage PhiPA3]AEH03778.1 hypothetical protein [Pseudomonas phage PhiPA3]